MLICIIGAGGYIGSFISKELEKKHHVSRITAKQQSYDEKFIKQFDVIIYLGGISDKNMKPEDIKTNIDEIVTIAKIMEKKQLLVYASTSAILEGYRNADEEQIIDETKLQPYPFSMLKREQIIKELPINSVGLRLASVIGISENQRDVLHVQMLKSALFTGRIHVHDPLSFRPIISMDDLKNVFNCIIENKSSCIGSEIYNIVSYNTTIGDVATNISFLTDSEVIGSKDTSYNTKGFSIINDKFVKKFCFSFKSNDLDIIRNLLENKKELLDSWSNPMKETIPCFICGNTNLMEMVDFKLQPLANQFTLDERECAEYPLGMYRCLKCYHNQLNHVIPPEDLFTDYIYVTGTTQTMVDYSDDFYRKHLGGTGNKTQRVLDIACNDGTQLDSFKKEGWETYGVDPAENLESISSGKGHKILVGFWGNEEITRKFLELSDNKAMDVIIAQNVFAHVPNPTKFLEECRKIMNENTKLYIQTSQAELFQNCEFDTIYHEHLSFFTVKSMLELSKRCDIYLEDVTKVPVHGTSYVFCFTKFPDSGQKINPKVEKMIENESIIYHKINPIFYRCNVLERKNILCHILNTSKQNGFKIAAFGASAKGNTLLNYIKDGCHLPEYVIDENPRKQNHYTPGTKIIVSPISKLEQETGDVAILILAWNFIEEIKKKIIESRKTENVESKKTILIVPFPDPTILTLIDGVFTLTSCFKTKTQLDIYNYFTN